MTRIFLIAGTAVAALLARPAQARHIWTPAEAKAWCGEQPCLIGTNYNNRDAINQFAMWQAETFDPQQIDDRRRTGWR